MTRPLSDNDLVAAVGANIGRIAVVTGDRIKDWCNANGVDYQGIPGRANRNFENADKAEYHGHRRLQKWKAPPPHYQAAPNGWSPSEAADANAYARAEQWAIENGWDRLEHEGGHWVRYRHDPGAGTWVRRDDP